MRSPASASEPDASAASSAKAIYRYCKRCNHNRGTHKTGPASPPPGLSTAIQLCRVRQLQVAAFIHTGAKPSRQGSPNFTAEQPSSRGKTALRATRNCNLSKQVLWDRDCPQPYRKRSSICAKHRAWRLGADPRCGTSGRQTAGRSGTGRRQNVRRETQGPGHWRSGDQRLPNCEEEGVSRLHGHACGNTG
jgi:hypothetical protein